MSCTPFIASPKKRTSKQARPLAEVEARIVRVTFHNHDNGFSVLQVSPEGGRGLETVVGFASSVAAGVRSRATGRWQSCEGGRQLRAEAIRTELPSNPEEMKRCLGSGLVDGIGPAYAGRFMDVFGGKIFDVIDKHPEKLLAVEGVGKKRCDIIARSWTEQKTERTAVNYLIDHGVASEIAVKIFRQYGDDTVKIVKENPYRLLQDFRGIDFQVTDALAKNIGYGLHSHVRTRAGIFHVLNDVSAGLGNCCQPRGELEAMAAEFLGVPKRVIAKAIGAEIESGRLVASDMPEPGSIYSAELFGAEEGVVNEIQRLISNSLPRHSVDVNSFVEAEEKKIGFQFIQTQKDALTAALTSGVSVITGGPGMGKTTVLKTLFAILESEGKKCELCAPSETAAVRLADLTKRGAKSIRKLLEYSIAEGKFRRNQENPIECDWLVVSDATVLDITMAHRLLEAVPSNAVVIFVGDRDLMPSAGPGMFFSDLIDSQVVPVTEFSEVLQEGDASWIAKVAHEIRLGKVPHFPSKADDGNCYFLRVDDREGIPSVIQDLVKKRLTEAYRINRLRDIQILCPMNLGETGTEAFNAMLRHDLTGLWGEIGRFGHRFAKGDKVMQTVDNLMRAVCAGEAGYVTEVDCQARDLYVNFNGRVVCYTFDDLDELVPSYAVTVDTARGIEFPGVVVPLSMEHFIMLRRDILYTAVTRGQKLVVLVGEPEALETAVKRTANRKRKTGLVERLMRGVSELD